jgi:hypothetical protein
MNIVLEHSDPQATPPQPWHQLGQQACLAGAAVSTDRQHWLPLAEARRQSFHGASVTCQSADDSLPHGKPLRQMVQHIDDTGRDGLKA